jgi:hypothetical protein
MPPMARAIRVGDISMGPGAQPETSRKPEQGRRTPAPGRALLAVKRVQSKNDRVAYRSPEECNTPSAFSSPSTRMQMSSRIPNRRAAAASVRTRTPSSNSDRTRHRNPSRDCGSRRSATFGGGASAVTSLAVFRSIVPSVVHFQSDDLLRPSPWTFGESRVPVQLTRLDESRTSRRHSHVATVR